jgi:hypothetical protein
MLYNPVRRETSTDTVQAERIALAHISPPSLTDSLASLPVVALGKAV